MIHYIPEVNDFVVTKNNEIVKLTERLNTFDPRWMTKPSLGGYIDEPYKVHLHKAV
jgi:hypothetical protein